MQMRTYKLLTEIVNSFNILGIVAKNKWRNLRDTFSRKLAELNQPSGSGYKHVRWKYFEQMSFLKDTLTSRPRSGNLEEVEGIYEYKNV